MATTDLYNTDLIACTKALRETAPAARARHGELDIALHDAGTDLWLDITRRGQRNARGGLTLRTPLLSPGGKTKVETDTGDALIRVSVTNEAGDFSARLWAGDPMLEYLRWEVVLTPSRDLHVPYLPRDLVAHGPDGDPAACEGQIEASQRRMNTGLVYAGFAQPAFGKLLYLQDLGALNGWFLANGTKPEGAVGGTWPLMGYLPPADPGRAEAALAKGQELVLYDTHLILRAKEEEDERESAWQFLDMLATAYRGLVIPPTERRDWVKRSEETLRDLTRAAELRGDHYGRPYFHPYTAAEYPDSMVQLAILSAVEEWAGWTGTPQPLAREIIGGMERFFDPKVKTLRRYLPDVGADKNPDAVDSWYLYHPLLSLSRLALKGHDWARDLFLRSVGHGIEAARHFEYKWPIMYDVKDFTVIREVAEADGRGQTDVGGIYAWVMLQAFKLTGDAMYLKEARAAIEAARGMRFNLNYQANLTAWGATACIALWRITDDKTYLAQSYVYLASFFHNCQIWESGIGWAAHYSNFMGATCLQDAPYMAMYECYDSYAAFEHYLDLGGPDVIPSVRLLLGEYCRHALHRAWWYYPDALPAGALAPNPRNGHVDARLVIPVEDLYPDGQQAGQVGQETYGAGAAMIFATRSYHRWDDAPFLLFCDHFLRATSRVDRRTVSFLVDGEADIMAQVAVIASGRGKLPAIHLRGRDGERLEPVSRSKHELCWEIPAGSVLLLSW